LLAFLHLGGMREPLNVPLFSEGERNGSPDSETRLTVYPHVGGSTNEYVCIAKRKRQLWDRLLTQSLAYSHFGGI